MKSATVSPSQVVMVETPNRNLALDLVRVTEAAALAAGHWMGRGQEEAGDSAAVEAMRLILSTIDMDGVVVIGEGAKKAPAQYPSPCAARREPSAKSMPNIGWINYARSARLRIRRLIAESNVS